MQVCVSFQCEQTIVGMKTGAVGDNVDPPLVLGVLTVPLPDGANATVVVGATDEPASLTGLVNLSSNLEEGS